MTHDPTSQRFCLAFTAFCVLACGGGEPDGQAAPAAEGGAASPAGSAAEVAPVSPAPAAPDVSALPVSPAVPDASGAAPCAAPQGVSAAPRTIGEALALMNALPKPTSVACLVESLARPLDVYMTRSELSAQPADGARNPRTFLVLDPLFLSIVPDGPASALVEVGYRTAPGRSIKAEILFPLTHAVGAADLIERVKIGRLSTCSGCHTDEQRVTSDIFAGTEGAFESSVIPPFFAYEVDVEGLRAEASACDALAEPTRCEMLGALFAHGEVRASALWASSDDPEL